MKFLSLLMVHKGVILKNQVSYWLQVIISLKDVLKSMLVRHLNHCSWPILPICQSSSLYMLGLYDVVIQAYLWPFLAFEILTPGCEHFDRCCSWITQPTHEINCCLPAWYHPPPTPHPHPHTHTPHIIYLFVHIDCCLFLLGFLTVTPMTLLSYENIDHYSA